MDQQHDAAGDRPIIVAVSASGARTRSLAQLLARLPERDRAAVVVVLQWREALDDKALAVELDGAGIDPTVIADGMPIEPGQIYLPPPDVILTTQSGRFVTRPADRPPGERGTIDSLLVALAREAEGGIIAVALTGTHADGTLGFTAVKEAGGLTLAEETPESRSGELGMSDSPAALADAVLPASLLGERIGTYIRHLAQIRQDSAAAADRKEVAAALSSIATLLRNKTGHDFHGYKQGTFLRRVQRRIQVVQADSLEHYVEVLRNRPDEPQNLFNDLLIGVTQFFRDKAEFDLLEREVMPKLFEGKTRSDQLRVWVIGCSTGEEAYSIAILLREHMARLDEVPHVQIFATDLDGRALASARAGRYAASVAQDISPERLARWFIKEGDTYCVTKELREICIFSPHSVVRDAPFSRIDLVSCRNLLIYLDTELQSRVIPLFHFALRPGGALFIGSSENLSRHTTLFTPIESRSRIFRRVDTATRALPELFVTGLPHRAASAIAAKSERPRLAEASLTRRAARVAEHYAPAYIIVDQAYDVLHFSGRMGRYIEPAGGIATLNLFQLVHSDLRPELRTALERAAKEDRTVPIDALEFGDDSQRLTVNVVVEPVRDTPGAAPSFIVLFRDGAGAAAGDDGGLASPAASGEHARRLESDLRTAKDRLQTTVEELETTNEELKSSNEEYQSLNEELQAANEELQTSKEEMQSINEELTTVNGELGHRVQELARANSDLKNLLESTQIATIFLDNELRITNYTPAIGEIFHVIPSDLGRPIGHVKPVVPYDDLQDDVRRVLRTLAIVEREIENPATGARFIVRILPYRSTDNFIAGVVLTFVDITARIQAEDALRDREQRFRAIVESALDYAILTTDADGRVDDWLPGATAVFGWSPEEAIGQAPEFLYTPEDRANDLWGAEFGMAREQGVAPDVRWHMRKDGRRVFIEGSTRALRDPSGRVTGVIKIGQDVTERRRGEEALLESEGRAKLLLAELQHRVRNTLAVVRSIARRTARTSRTVEDYAAHLEGRLDAFARVQAAVTRNPTGGIDLEQLFASELLAHVAHEGEQIVRIEGPKVRLQPKAAETMALVIHELATNAIKYGALSSPNGRIAIGWQVADSDAPPHLDIAWAETGVKLSSEPPEANGFGTELIKRTLTYDLGGEADLSFAPGGAQCTIRLPLGDQVQLGRDRPAQD